MKLTLSDILLASQRLSPPSPLLPQPRDQDMHTKALGVVRMPDGQLVPEAKVVEMVERHIARSTQAPIVSSYDSSDLPDLSDSAPLPRRFDYTPRNLSKERRRSAKAQAHHNRHKK